MTREQIERLVEAWVDFCYNFPRYTDIIEHLTKDESLQNHFKGKFLHKYDIVGAEAVIQDFYLDLDDEYRRALVDFFFTRYLDDADRASLAG